jgi:hypothetical protein
LLLDGLLEARPGSEARDAAGGDRHRLARTRVATLAGPALGDVELAEAGEVDVLTTPQRILDGADDRVDGVVGVLLRQTAR